MFNFFRRSKTKDNIEYNKNRVETFKQLSQENGTEISATLAPAPQRLVKRSKTMEITTVPFVINNSNVSASTSSLSKNPFVANICDLVYLNNNETQKSSTFKDIVMAPAMGWRNKKQKRKKQQKTHASVQPNATIEETKNPRENVILRTFSANIENDLPTPKNNVELNLNEASSSNTIFPKVCKKYAEEMGGNQVSKTHLNDDGKSGNSPSNNATKLYKNESEPTKQPNLTKNESDQTNLVKIDSAITNLTNNPQQNVRTAPNNTSNSSSNENNKPSTLNNETKNLSLKSNTRLELEKSSSNLKPQNNQVLELVKPSLNSKPQNNQVLELEKPTTNLKPQNHKILELEKPSLNLKPQGNNVLELEKPSLSLKPSSNNVSKLEKPGVILKPQNNQVLELEKPSSNLKPQNHKILELEKPTSLNLKPQSNNVSELEKPSSNLKPQHKQNDSEKNEENKVNCDSKKHKQTEMITVATNKPVSNQVEIKPNSQNDTKIETKVANTSKPLNSVVQVTASKGILKGKESIEANASSVLDRKVEPKASAELKTPDEKITNESNKKEDSKKEFEETQRNKRITNNKEDLETNKTRSVVESENPKQLLQRIPQNSVTNDNCVNKGAIRKDSIGNTSKVVSTPIVEDSKPEAKVSPTQINITKEPQTNPTSQKVTKGNREIIKKDSTNKISPVVEDSKQETKVAVTQRMNDEPKPTSSNLDNTVVKDVTPHLKVPKKPALKTNESKSSPALRVSFSEDVSISSSGEVHKCEVPKPFTVCSIAIPLPSKILKSDKIPVTSIIERTEPHRELIKTEKKVIENGEIGNVAESNGEIKTKNLVNQEERFQTQITDLKKQLEKRDKDALEITYEMEELHRDVFVKSSGMDRLQAELVAANKESEYVRKRLRHLEDDLQTFRDKNNDLTEDLEKKTEDYERLHQSHDEQISELEQNVRHLIQQIQLLETHNSEFREKIEQLERERSELQYERDEEKKIVQNAIETAIAEKQSIQQRWEKDFEKLRTVNTTREQQLLDDFEWKLREVEQSCKKRLEDKEKQIQVQLKTAEQQLNEVIHLKSYEAEVKQLRGLTDEQQQSIAQLSQRIEELQTNEQQLREEVIKLLKQIEIDNTKMVTAKQQFEIQLQEKSREMQVELDRQRGDVAVKWEERMYKECARLKSEMEQIYNEEKGEAVQAVKKQKQQEYDHLKKIWEKRIEECDKEINTLRKNLTEKEESYQKEFERVQTKADRDIMELRRSLDKTDMTYNDQIEKLTENHDKEIGRLSEEYEKKIKDLETNWQMQVTSTRTTLELVKEQMERDAQDKLQALDQHHRSQLERQWDQLVQDKEEALQQMEQNYRNNCMKLKEEICNLQKSNVDKEARLQATIDDLKLEINGKNSQLLCLQNNVDTLHGGIHVLNREIKSHGHEMQKIQNTCEKKIRHVRDSLLAEQSRRINQLKQQHAVELEKHEQGSAERADHLEKKCQCLTKLFEEMRTRYNEKDASNTENENVIAELRQQIAEQRMQIENLTQKSYCSKSEQKEYQRKGGGGEKTLQNLPDLTNTMGTDF